ncbi:uncharacterized protein LOC133194554 [Saccostrea echinata]|uniref:uncharacterized protein LOC133194554 n=1 Tax=Saccostrea echinata TaxID=191078 RepID=UPI002A7EC14B|nr:uncharacterized protein LOC133194554 [Saccostrea echinata]
MVWQNVNKNTFGYVIPCTDSLKTVSNVLSCPKNLSELKKAIERKSCYKWNHSCRSFEYHCVINDWTNETMEVCAPSLLIIGGICTEFNLDEMSIRGSFLTNCTAFDTPCPSVYRSTTSYKYSECYLNLQRRGTSSVKTNFTSSDGMHKEDEENFTLIVSLVFVSVTVLCIIAVVLYFIRKREKYRQICVACANKNKTDKGSKVRYTTPNGSDQVEI